MTKELVYNNCIQHLQNTLNIYQKEYASLKNDLLSESKCTAGDKHETGRAMLHLETEKLGKLISEKQRDLDFLSSLKNKEESNFIQVGSLINTSIGWLFISVGLGKISFNNTTIFALSAVAPISKVLINKKVGDQVILNNKQIDIKTIL